MFKFTDTKALSEAGAWVHIQDDGRPAYWPDKKGKPDKSKPVRIKVYGPDSETFKEKARKRAAKLLKETGGKNDFGKMGLSEIEALIERGEENGPAEWADRTITWENVPGEDGSPCEFTHAAAEALYANYPSIIAQLAQDAAERSDFLALT